MKGRYGIELMAGIFVLLGLGCLGYLSIRLGGLKVGGPGGYRVTAVFSDIGGLREGAEVVIAGVRVGDVEGVALKDYAGEVTLYLFGGVEIPTDSIASIKTRGLIGEQFVALSPGGAEEILAPGGRIRQTEAAVDLQSLISRYAFGEVK